MSRKSRILRAAVAALVVPVAMLLPATAHAERGTEDAARGLKQVHRAPVIHVSAVFGDETGPSPSHIGGWVSRAPAHARVWPERLVEGKWVRYAPEALLHAGGRFSVWPPNPNRIVTMRVRLGVEGSHAVLATSRVINRVDPRPLPMDSDIVLEPHDGMVRARLEVRLEQGELVTFGHDFGYTENTATYVYDPAGRLRVASRDTRLRMMARYGTGTYTFEIFWKMSEPVTVSLRSLDTVRAELGGPPVTVPVDPGSGHATASVIVDSPTPQTWYSLDSGDCASFHSFIYSNGFVGLDPDVVSDLPYLERRARYEIPILHCPPGTTETTVTLRPISIEPLATSTSQTLPTVAGHETRVFELPVDEVDRAMRLTGSDGTYLMVATPDVSPGFGRTVAAYGLPGHFEITKWGGLRVLVVVRNQSSAPVDVALDLDGNETP